VVQIEKAITSGSVLVLYNIDQHIDSLFMPLIHHINTAVSENPFKGMLETSELSTDTFIPQFAGNKTSGVWVRNVTGFRKI
jgi:hypothetical protein